MSNATYNLGRVGLNLRGGYSPTTAYEPLDVVAWRGGSYAAKANSIGVAPGDTDRWQPLAQGLPAHSTQEQATGSLWLNGKPIYAKTLMFATPATANAAMTYALDMGGMDAAWVDASSTFWLRKEGTLVDHIGYIAGDSGRQFMVQLQREANSILVISDGVGCATVRILYTKAADAPTYYYLPFLTSDNDQGCTASASSVYSTFNPYLAFNGNLDDMWRSLGTPDTQRWVQVQMPYALKNMVVTLADRGDVSSDHRRANSAGSFSGSNDGTTWTALLSFTGRNPNFEDSFTSVHGLGNSDGYKYLRYTASPGSYDPADNFSTSIADIRIQGEVA